ncbi:hypothetical protein HPB49_024136 [Dermacentor silvarum]|uniref:Uncharacterized protein n=1 Tax=Dermacentor silvarum TaxID=543639 RepID=A0ACB8CTN0_DERSI|nr:hypothetical protein HPB49_024136 [Dermacentor silvarum]
MFMSPGGSQLSLVAQFDDLCRRHAAYTDTATEELMLEFVRNQEACRRQWHAAIIENAELKKQIASLTEMNVELERNLAHTKEVLRKELLRRERCEEETLQKQRQLDQVRSLLANNTEIRDETAEKLSILMPADNGPQDRAARLSIIDESVGSVLSPSGDDLDVTDESAEFFNMPNSQGKRRHCFFEGISPVEKKSKVNDERDRSFTNMVHTTVTVADGKDLCSCWVVVCGCPCYCTRLLQKDWSGRGWKFILLSFLSCGLGIEGSAPNTPVSQRRGKVAASATMPRRSNSAEKLLSRQHTFCPKTVIKAESCGPCGKRIKFYRTVYRCSRCNAICHPECKYQVPLPCIPVCETPKSTGTGCRRGTLISDHVPSTAPMVPALVVHCIQEVERRGLDCVGLYRVSGSEREVREIRERFQQGKGVPNLSKVDIYAVCGVLKDFLLSLRESLVTKSLWHTFVSATELEHEDRVWAMWQAVTQLPPANRDTLAALVLHLQTVAAHPEAKMPLSNLARIFAPTVVGCSVNDVATVPNLLAEMEQQNQVGNGIVNWAGRR